MVLHDVMHPFKRFSCFGSPPTEPTVPSPWGDSMDLLFASSLQLFAGHSGLPSLLSARQMRASTCLMIEQAITIAKIFSEICKSAREESMHMFGHTMQVSQRVPELDGEQSSLWVYV